MKINKEIFLIKKKNNNLKNFILKKKFQLIKNKLFLIYNNNNNLNYYYENNKINNNLNYVYLKNFGEKLDFIKKNNIKFNKTLFILTNYKQIIFKNNNFIKKGELFLIEKKINENTQDITQGLPKVSSILELKIRRSYKTLNNTSFLFDTNKLSNVLINTYSKFFYNEKFRNNKKNNLYILNKTAFYKKNYSSPENLLWFYFSIYIKKYSLIKSIEYSTLKTQKFLIKTLNNIYNDQKISISPSNFEIIIKQMFSRIIIISESDTIFFKYEELNIKLYNYLYIIYNKLNYIIPLVLPKIFGITRTTIKDNDLLSSISFQNTTNLIIEACLKGNKDWLTNLKSNIILGQELPFGTNFLKKNYSFDEISDFINKI